MINPSGFFYYAPYPGYYNQIPSGHHPGAAAAAAAQHATGHPIYVSHGPPMAMYGHHMMGAYPQGMIMYPTAGGPPQGAVVQAGGPVGMISPEYAAYGEATANNKGNFAPVTVPVVTSAGEFDGPSQGMQGPPLLDQQAPQMVAPTQIWTAGGQMPVDYQEMVVVEGNQPLPQGQMTEGGGEAVEEYSNAVVVVVDEGYMEQPSAQTPTHVHHTLNPNVANFMPLKQQQEQQQLLNRRSNEQQVVSDVYAENVGDQGRQYSTVMGEQQQQPPPQLSYDLNGHPILMDESQANHMVFMSRPVEEEVVAVAYDADQMQVPLNVITMGDPVQVAVDQQLNNNNIINSNATGVNNNNNNILNNSNNNNHSPKVPVVEEMKKAQQQQQQPQDPQQQIQEVPNVKLNHTATTTSTSTTTTTAEDEGEEYLSTMVEDKMYVSANMGKGKAWAQKPTQPANTSHDPNNNVPAKKQVTTTSVAVTAVPGRSPMVSPKANEPGPEPPVNGKPEKANAILQTDVPQQKKLETNTVSVTATPAGINGGGGGGGDKAAPAPTTAPAPSSWASLFASSQKAAAAEGGNANGMPVVGANSKRPVAKVLPFASNAHLQSSGQAGSAAGTMSYSAASSIGLSVSGGTNAPVNSQPEVDSNTSAADRRGMKLGGKESDNPWLGLIFDSGLICSVV